VTYSVTSPGAAGLFLLENKFSAGAAEALALITAMRLLFRWFIEQGIDRRRKLDGAP